MPPIPTKTPMKASAPKLVNRGAAGLLTKATGLKQSQEETPAEVIIARAPKNHIADALKGMVVAIDSLVPDPMNARLHPERNMEAIKLSLASYKQVKPVVARRETNVVIAGNGTLAAAKELGWTEIAANFVDMTEAEAAGYGLADNRSAELAKWDFEVVAKLDKMIQECGGTEMPMVGWTMDELQVLREAEWVPPGSADAPDEDTKTITIVLTEQEKEMFEFAASHMREKRGTDLTDGECLAYICNDWLEDA